MNTREETRKFNVIKDLSSIPPTVHTERNLIKKFGPPLAIPETPEQLEQLGDPSFNSRGYEDTIGNEKGFGEVLENSTPTPPKETSTIGDQIDSVWIWWWWDSRFKNIRL